MKALITTLTLILATVFTPAPSAANAKPDGNYLIEACAEYLKSNTDKTRDQINSAYCDGMISGIGFALSVQKEGSTYRMCPPDVLESQQAARIVYDFLQDNTTQLHFDAPDLVAAALTQAYPCE